MAAATVAGVTVLIIGIITAFGSAFFFESRGRKDHPAIPIILIFLGAVAITYGLKFFLAFDEAVLIMIITLWVSAASGFNRGYEKFKKSAAAKTGIEKPNLGPIV